MGVWQCPNCDKWSTDTPRYDQVRTEKGYVRSPPYLQCLFCGLRVELPVKDQREKNED